MIHNIYSNSTAVFLVTDDETYITDEDGLTYLVIKGYDTLKKILSHLSNLKNIPSHLVPTS